MTHLEYVQAVRDIVVTRLNAEEQATIARATLVYGAGSGTNARGLTFYGAWTCASGKCEHQGGEHGTPPARADLVEICAFGEDSLVQLAGTTIHELAHVLAGVGHGHDKAWAAACVKLGLRRCKAAGTHYVPALFSPDIRERIAALPAPSDGSPRSLVNLGFVAIPLNLQGKIGARGCTAGQGARGGKSHGKGSGRMRKYVCGCEHPVIVRVARDDFAAHCDHCGEPFKQET